MMEKDHEPEPACFCSDHEADEANEARIDLIVAILTAIILTPAVAVLANWLLPIVWGWK